MLQELYWEKGLSIQQVAKEVCRNPETIREKMIRYGIQRRDGRNRRPWVTKEVIMDLYWNKGLSIRQVAKELRVSDSTVHHRIAKFKIPKKSRMKYQKTPFSGDLIEMNHLLGVRAGDFSARKCHRQIRVWVTTTHPAIIKLFRDSFEKYTNVYKFPTYGDSKVKYKWRMYALVDRSFEFMVKKSELIPEETFNDEHGFLAFLAGYTDAEGSLIISRSRESIRYVYTISSEDHGLLNGFKDKLTKMGFHVSLRL